MPYVYGVGIAILHIVLHKVIKTRGAMYLDIIYVAIIDSDAYMHSYIIV